MCVHGDSQSSQDSHDEWLSQAPGARHRRSQTEVIFLRTHFLSWHSSAWSTGQERCNISSSFRARSQRCCCSWEECPSPNHRRTWDLSVCHGSHVWKCLTHIVPCEVLWVLAYFESSLVSLCTALPQWLLKQHFPFSLCWFCLFFFSDFSEDVFPLVLGVAYLWPEFVCGSVTGLMVSTEHVLSVRRAFPVAGLSQFSWF